MITTNNGLWVGHEWTPLSLSYLCFVSGPSDRLYVTR